MINRETRKRPHRLRKVDDKYELKINGKTYEFDKKPRGEKSRKYLESLVLDSVEKLIKRSVRNGNKIKKYVKKNDKKKQAVSTPATTFGYSTFSVPSQYAVERPYSLFYPGGYLDLPKLPTIEQKQPKLLENKESPKPQLAIQLQTPPRPPRPVGRIEQILPTLHSIREEIENEKGPEKGKPGIPLPVYAIPIYSVPNEGEIRGKKSVQVFDKRTEMNKLKVINQLFTANSNIGQNTLIDNKTNGFEELKARYLRVNPENEEEKKLSGFILTTNNLVGSGLKHTPNGAGISDEDCNNLMSKWTWFQGTIMRDELKEVLKKAIEMQWDKWGIIINTQSSAEGNGEHWTALYVDLLIDRSVEFYDPFGNPPNQEIEQDLKEYIDKLDLPYLLKFKVNSNKTQHDKSDTCGYHACLFLEDRFIGRSFCEATGYKKEKAGITKREKRIDKKFGLI